METVLYMDGQPLSAGDASLFYPDEDVKCIRWEEKDHLYQFVLGPEQVQILSQNEVAVTLELSPEEGKACVVSEHGKMVLPARLVRYRRQESQADIMYELEGGIRSFRLEWKES